MQKMQKNAIEQVVAQIRRPCFAEENKEADPSIHVKYSMVNHALLQFTDSGCVLYGERSWSRAQRAAFCDGDEE